MLNDKVALQKAINEKPLRHVATDLGVSYSKVRTAVIKLGVVIPKRNGLVYTEETRKRKSESQKAAYKRKYPNGRFGKDHPGWKGGRTTSPGGYVWIYMPEHHRASNGRVFEHILVAEEKLGRKVTRDEVVHHINHVKTDNRPENLEVVGRGEHVRNHFNEPIQLQKELELAKEETRLIKILLKSGNKKALKEYVDQL